MTAWDYVENAADAGGGLGQMLGGKTGKAIANPYGYAKDASGGFGGIPGMGGLGSLGPDKASVMEPPNWSGNMQQSRGQLQGAIDPIQQWALTGQGPSAAQAQLQSGKDQAMAAAGSQAKSVYGVTPGQQASLATNAGAQVTQQAANQAAQLRAQEQQQAMANYLAAVNAQRQGDIDIYKAYSDQYAQTNMANAQSGNAFKGGLIGTAAGVIGNIL